MFNRKFGKYCAGVLFLVICTLLYSNYEQLSSQPFKIVLFCRQILSLLLLLIALLLIALSLQGVWYNEARAYLYMIKTLLMRRVQTICNFSDGALVCLSGEPILFNDIFDDEVGVDVNGCVYAERCIEYYQKTCTSDAKKWLPFENMISQRQGKSKHITEWLKNDMCFRTNEIQIGGVEVHNIDFAQLLCKRDEQHEAQLYFYSFLRGDESRKELKYIRDTIRERITQTADKRFVTKICLSKHYLILRQKVHKLSQGDVRISYKILTLSHLTLIGKWLSKSQLIVPYAFQVPESQRFQTTKQNKKRKKSLRMPLMTDNRQFQLQNKSIEETEEYQCKSQLKYTKLKIKQQTNKNIFNQIATNQNQALFSTLRQYFSTKSQIFVIYQSQYQTISQFITFKSRKWSNATLFTRFQLLILMLFLALIVQFAWNISTSSNAGVDVEVAIILSLASYAFVCIFSCIYYRYL